MMDSKGTTLFCGSCHKTYEMDEQGNLHGQDGVTEFTRVKDWYEWERANVRKQIEDKTYAFADDVRVDSLPNSKGFFTLGIGRLVHDLNGFHATGNFDGEEFKIDKEPLSMYSTHIEYDYLGKGEDGISFSTLNDTYYFYPQHAKNVVTKLHFATEELYKITLDFRKNH
jgi:hypothetical protein